MKKADFPPLWPPGIHPVTLDELRAVAVTPFLADARRAIIFASFKQWIQNPPPQGVPVRFRPEAP